jgi:hypothetical protein
MKQLLLSVSSATTEFQSVLPANDIYVSPNFFIVIFAGVVIALAFQFILTAISAAAGVSAIGNVKESYVNAKVDPSGNKAKENHDYNEDSSSDTSMGVKITTAFGIWSVITTCIAHWPLI